MRNIILFLVSAILFGACALFEKTTKEYELVCVDSGIVEEDGYFAKKYISGNRDFLINSLVLTRKDDSIRFKGVIICAVTMDTVVFPKLCLVSGESSNYKIEKELFSGDLSGKIDCVFQWDFRKGYPKIAIDALAYQGGVYIVRPRSSAER